MSEAILTPGSVYETADGRFVEFLRVDRCWGEVTFKFRTFDHPEPDYIRPTELKAYLRSVASEVEAAA